MVKQSVSEFKKGRRTNSGETRSGRPIEVKTPEMTEKIHKKVMENLKLKVSDIAENTRTQYLT